MRIIVHKFEILVLEVEDTLYLRIYLHLRQGTRLAGKLKLHLLEMVGVDVGITCSVYKFTRFKTADLIGDLIVNYGKMYNSSNSGQ